MAEGMNRSLMIFSPLMSYFIALQVPSGLVLYWTVSNLFQILQQFIANEVVYKKLKHKKEEEERKRQLEKQAQKMQEVEGKQEKLKMKMSLKRLKANTRILRKKNRKE